MSCGYLYPQSEHFTSLKFETSSRYNNFKGSLIYPRSNRLIKTIKIYTLLIQFYVGWIMTRYLKRPRTKGILGPTEKDRLLYHICTYSCLTYNSIIEVVPYWREYHYIMSETGIISPGRRAYISLNRIVSKVELCLKNHLAMTAPNRRPKSIWNISFSIVPYGAL